MRIAVTGAGGFLGGYVCRELYRRGCDFVATYRKRLPEIDGNFECLQMDIAKAPEDVFARLGKPDLLIHLAWSGLPNYRNESHVRDELPIQVGFLKRIVAGGLGSLLVSGTCLEYGMQQGMLDETMEARPDNPYAVAKVKLSRELFKLRQQIDFRLTWARLFYMFGDGQSPNSLWTQFRNAVQNDARRFDMSGGQQVRDFLRVEKVASLIVDLCQANAHAGIVNVCSGVPISVESLVRKWAIAASWNGELNLGHYPYPDYEPMSFWGSCARLESILEQTAGDVCNPANHEAKMD